MSLTLMTTPQLRARIDTALSDAALELLAGDCEDAITEHAGPLAFTGDPAAPVDVTETVYARGHTLARLQQVPLAITSAVDWAGDTDTTLDDVAYRIRDTYVERADGAFWGDRTVFTYTPTGAVSKRRLALVKLVQLELNHEPGMSSQQAGPWAERYAKYEEDRQAILDTVFQPDLFA